MYRSISLLAGAALVAGSLALSTTAVAADTDVYNPTSSAHGATLGEWMETYFRWIYTGEEPDLGENMELLPMPSASSSYVNDDGLTVLVGEEEVELSTEDAFVLPIVARVGEAWPDGSEDTPLPDFVFTDLIAPTAEVTLDGDVLLEDPADYYVGTVDFDPEIEYDEPDSSGYTSAVFLQGIGFVGKSLDKGDHVLVNYVEIPPAGIAFYNTWYITVE